MKYLLLIIILLIPLNLAAEQKNGIDFFVTADTFVIDAAWTKQVAIKVGLQLIESSGVGVKLPFNFVIDRSGSSEAIFESALQLIFYPWQKGPFINLTLAQIDLFIGPYLPPQKIHYLNEIAFGYTYRFLPSWFVQLSLLYRDPSNTFIESFEYINSHIPSFQKFRFSLEFGWKFLTVSAKEEK